MRNGSLIANRRRRGGWSALVVLLFAACGGSGSPPVQDGGIDQDAADGVGVAADSNDLTGETGGDVPNQEVDGRDDTAGDRDTGNTDMLVADGGGSDGADTSGDAGGQSDGAVGTSQMVLLPVAAVALVSDPSRSRVYASVRGDADLYANTIAVIDASSNSVVSSIPVGSNPGPLAISDDGSTLWVGVQGALSIRKITVPSATAPAVVGPLIHLPMDRQGLSYGFPLSLAVVHGAPNSVVVAMSNSRDNITVFDDGISRPTTINMTNTAPTALIAGPPGFVFGFSSSIEQALSVLAITPSGVSRNDYQGLGLGGGRTDGFYMNGRLYLSGGVVIDVTDPMMPSRPGAFAWSGAVAARDAQHVLMTTVQERDAFEAPDATLRILDPETFTQIAGVPLPLPKPVVTSQSLEDLVYAGDDAAVFLITQISAPNQLAIIHSPLIRSPVPGVRVDADGGVGLDGADSNRPAEECAGCRFSAVAAYGRQMIYDRSRNLIYITAEQAATANKNSLVTVDPVAGTVVSVLAVGGDPGPMAISDDASTLWLGNSQDRTIQKVTLGASQIAGPAYSLPAADAFTTTPSVAGSLVVLSGTTSSVAAAISGPAVAILDEGVPRATIDKDRFASGYLVRGAGATLFGFDSFHDFGVLSVAASGVTQKTFGGLLVGNNLYRMVYLDGALYGSDGTVIDVSKPEAPLPGGRISYFGDAIAVRSPNRLLMLINDGSSSQTPVLRVLDSTTLASVAAAFFPESAIGRVPGIADMVYIGGDAVAVLVFKNSTAQLNIVHANVIGTPP